MRTWTIDKDKVIVEPKKASDILYGPDATDEWPGWPYPEQTRENSNVTQENDFWHHKEEENEQVFEDCDPRPEDSHSNEVPEWHEV